MRSCQVTSQPDWGQTQSLYLTAEQVARLAETITPEYRTLIYFAAYTGCRAGEATALRVRDLNLMDPRHGRITVSRSTSDVRGAMHEGPTKANKIRSFEIPRFLTEMLIEQTAGKGPDDLVFTGATGAQLRHAIYYQRHFKAAVKEAFKDEPHLMGLRFHDLRHTCASLLIAAGTHPKAIANQLGHSTIAITMDRYGHLFPDQDAAVAGAMEDTFRAASG